MQYDLSTEQRNDFHDCNFVFTKKSGEDVYSFTKLQMLPNICKLALCFMIKSCSITWNLFPALGRCGELLQPKSSSV